MHLNLNEEEGEQREKEGIVPVLIMIVEDEEQN